MELKPCPFCGRMVKWNDHSTEPGWKLERSEADSFLPELCSKNCSMAQKDGEARMKTDDMIRELRRLEEAHRDDFVGTGETNWASMCHDVANRLEELLAAQTPRVMTLKEFGDVVYLELPGKEGVTPWLVHCFADGFCYLCDRRGHLNGYSEESYGRTWRCWTSRPTDEQRREAKW